ncbi:hypothetical protein JTE90_019274 [Oedothorax gibbosus]|uniref:Uncharacterized protein n=1 Tax=Oedothorax gibbosus TaxID=931172 RepID=A0AAV6UVJ4_9ARAC|nr:hypothetical protein JTE90_019274 [Oedothorax gibbosus]
MDLTFWQTNGKRTNRRPIKINGRNTYFLIARASKTTKAPTTRSPLTSSGSTRASEEANGPTGASGTAIRRKIN